MMSLRALLPDTLFGRLFAAIIAAMGIMLLVIVLLIVRERSQWSLFDSAAGSSPTDIAEMSEYLAGVPRAQRDEARRRLRALQMPEEVRRRLPRQRGNENPHAIERAFVARIQQQLGEGYQVTSGVPRRFGRDVVVLRPERQDSSASAPGAPGSREQHRLPPRVFDVSVTLPDGDRVVFRTLTPRPGPPMPRRIFVELAVLTALLGLVLYVMTRTITRPLAELARAADAMGGGTQSVKVEERGALELRRATRAFNAMQERLRRYLDSRTRVLAAMSHDLRTPLTRLRLRVESIEDEDLRQRCSADLDEMSSMVRSALAVFRGLNDDEAAVAVDINELVRELQRQYTETGAEVSIEGRAANACLVRPRALKRCLSNLVDNALQHGGRAAIRIDDGEELVIRICDAGPGIPEDQLEQVFEPFFRLESSRNRDTGGAGLGLSIARDIAQAHGGSLRLANRAAGGLEATLILPRTWTAGAPQAESPTATNNS
jgi:signal transduction histidine kinase